ncbi:MAG: lipopolysaccharide biosynthesis protein [Prevotella sp.]|nr:lipopolysaccharide biosynthesis protein [Prevotella sp.]
MEPTKRIIVNTGAQYTKAISNTCLSLYSTRLILEALQVTDFGIYALVGGVVAMLGFITNALVITTQRYVSYYNGKGDYEYVRKIFSNSLLLHILFGIAIACILLLLKGWLFSSVLNIVPERIDTARSVYLVTVLMLFITILTAPFKALFIAHENIVFVSVVDICDGIIKLFIAIGLAYVSADRLLVYAFLMAGIQLLNLLVFSLYARFKYEECHLRVHRRDVDRQAMSQLTGFAGWTTYGTGAVVARTHGITVIINHFYGTTANAAYGIAAQVTNAVIFVSSSIINAMNPQIMKAEGMGDRQKMLHLAGQESKYSVMLLALVSIPIMMEMPSILSVWLPQVPPHTVMFSRFAIAICLIDQFTIGLNAANQAQGHIGPYTLIMYTPKLLNLPFAWFLLSYDYSLEAVMWSIFIVEFVTAVLRLPYLKRTAGLRIRQFMRHAVLPVVPIIVMSIAACWCCDRLFHFPFSFLITFAVAILAGMVTAWAVTLTTSERAYIVRLIKTRIGK